MAVKDRAVVAEFLKANDGATADLHAQRARLDSLGDFFPVAAGVEVEPATVGGVKGEWVRARHARRDAALLYLHGGGYLLGSPKSHRHLAALLSEASDLPVFLPHYRLAPEHPFPAALDDAFAATQWIAANASELGIDPGRIAVGGDSAGGTLAAVVTQMAREKGPKLAFQLLMFPNTQMGGETDSLKEYAVGYFLERHAIEWFNGQYAPNETDRASALVSPLRAKDFARLPPAYVLLGGYDPLHDEGQAYAARLRAAGVAVTIADYPDMVHCFIYLQTVLPQAHIALADAAHAVSAALEAA